MAGVTLTGFVAKTVSDMTADLNAAWRSVFGATANVDPRSRNGQEIGIFAKASADLWKLAEAVAAALDPSSAGDVLLDNLSALTNTFRKAATPSTVDLTHLGVAGTVLSGAARVGVTGNTKRFIAGAATLNAFAVGDNWSGPFTVFAAGALCTNGVHAWWTRNGGVSGVTPPPGPVDWNDGGIDWLYLCPATGYVVHTSACEVTGPVPVYAETVNQILTPVAGWAKSFNRKDGTMGTNRELDPAMRTRRAQEVAGIGSAQLDAIRTKVSKIPNVTLCKIYENETDTTNGDGLPPHSVEILVEGGTDAAIAQALLDAGAGGIRTYGTSSATAFDSLSNAWVRKFSRPVTHNSYVSLFLTVDPANFPLNGAALCKQAVVAAGIAGGLGRDIVPSVLQAACFPVFDSLTGKLVRGVPGVLDVYSATLVGTAFPAASAAPIAMGSRDKALYDTGWVSVTTVAGVP